MRKMGKHIPGLIVTLVVLITAIVFAVMLLNMKVIPTKFIAVIGLVMLVLIVIVGALVWSTDGKIRFVVGVILAAVFAAVFILGSMYVYKTHSTLAGISGVNTEVTEVGIYVRADDAADSIGATADYVYGVLTDLDRANSDKAIQEVDSETGKTVQVQEFAGLTELVDGLLNGQTGAIVLNSAYLSVIEEMDGYSDISSRIRELTVKKVETTIEPQETEAKAEENTNDGSVYSIPVVSGIGRSNTPSGCDGSVYTIFISGIDSRSGLVAKSRSDSNIIATVNTATRQVLLVSTPRDYFVPLSISGGQRDKLTHAGIYGINVCMDTLGMLYNEDINYYFRINFAGFEQLIDALGGVTVYSDYDFDSKNETGYHFNQGENYLNGEQALVFSRERYAFKEGDRQRGKNQMAVIKGVINKALSPELLKNYSSVLSSIQGCFETNISYEEIARLLQQQLNNGGDWNIVSYSVNGTGDTQKPYSMSQKAYVMIPDESTVQKAETMMKKVRDGETVSQEEADGATSAAAATDNDAQAAAEGSTAETQGETADATQDGTADGTVAQQ